MENSVLAEVSPKSRSLFANRNFLLLFTGRLISRLGDSIYLFALTWYTFAKYSSPMLAGIMLMLGTVPTILLGPFGGVIADRLDRKKIIVLMEFVRAGVTFTIAVMEYCHMLNIWFLFLAAVILDICGAIFNPACTALVTNIVGEANLTAANSADTMTANSSNILGILGGGLMYATMGFATISLLNAVSFVVAGILEMMVTIPRKNRVAGTGPGVKPRAPAAEIVGNLIEGYRFLRSQTGLYQLFLFATIFNFLFAPFYSIYLPFILNKLIKAASGNLAYIQAAYAFGAILGAIVMMMLPKRLRLSRIIINGLWLSDVFIAGLIVPILPGLLVKTSVWIVTLYLAGLLLLTGICASMINIPVGVIFQKKVPDEVLGRVSGLIGSIVSAALPLGYLAGGAIAELFPLYLVISITVILLLLLTALMESNRFIREL